MDQYEKAMQGQFEIKIRGRMGAGANEDKEIRILNRIVRHTLRGLLYEADPRHAEILVRNLELLTSNPVVTPGAKDARNSDPSTMEDAGGIYDGSGL